MNLTPSIIPSSFPALAPHLELPTLTHQPPFPRPKLRNTAANMSRSRTPLVLGLAAAGGVGYYLYSSGGNVKVAEKKFESQSPAARLARTRRGPP